MLKMIGACVVSTVLLILSKDAFRQAPNEFHDTLPGSQLFGTLQVVIGTSALVAAVSLFMRPKWAAWSLRLWGIATAGLLIAQPLFTPMTSKAKWSIWLGAAVVGAIGAGLAWCAPHLARPAPATGSSAER